MTEDYQPDTRAFLDAEGIEWSVRELETDDLRGDMRRAAAGNRRRTTWLLFLAPDGDKRRLSPHPANWRILSEEELAACCRRAVHVPPAPARRPND